MRRLRYNVATSLDGFIAEPDGAYDWIIEDPSIDFAALFAEFDTALMGRRTFELLLAQGTGGIVSGMRTVVVSRTLRAEDYPAVTVVNDDAEAVVAALKAESGKDIWLFGGGSLFRTLLDAGLVDAVEVAVIPVLLGHGVPLLDGGPRSPVLRLTDSEVLPSGIVRLAYTLGGREG
ncbi:MAG: dihydrofolate reductase family protein [Rhodothermales bacterium]|nr:dihydrofolate reductase family protein [Rhodothermales bacterium]